MAIAFIFDCGATNLRTIAIDDTGKILSAHHLPNNTQPGVENPDYHIWAIDEIWGKLLTCAKQTLAELSPEQRQQIVGISVTTFGLAWMVRYLTNRATNFIRLFRGNVHVPCQL